jgi:hypothetical protein
LPEGKNIAPSLHLTEIAMGNRDFVAGSLVDVLEKKFKLDHDRPRIFSPFGLGVLDLAVGNFILEAAKSSGAAIALPDFFSPNVSWARLRMTRQKKHPRHWQEREPVGSRLGRGVHCAATL